MCGCAVAVAGSFAVAGPFAVVIGGFAVVGGCILVVGGELRVGVALEEKKPVETVFSVLYVAWMAKKYVVSSEMLQLEVIFDMLGGFLVLEVLMLQ